MRRTLTTGLVGGFLALTAAAWAQDTPPPSPPPAGEEQTTTETTTTTQETTTTETTTTTVTREEVRTWTMDIGDREFEVHPATPNYEGGTGLFHMPTAYSLPKGKFSIALFRDNVDRDPKDIDFSIHGINLGIGLADWAELSIQVGVQNRVNADALFQPGYYAELPFVNTRWETGFGDVRVGLKLAFLDDYDDDPVGLALRPWFKLPTANEEEGLGTGKPSFGADLLLSKGLGGAADIHFLVGGAKNTDPTEPFVRDIANSFRIGAGINIPACTKFQIQAELIKTYYTGDNGSDQFGQTNPLDLVVGPVIWFRPGIFIRPALSWNLNFSEVGLGDPGTKSWTGRHLEIGYHPGFGCAEIAAPPPPPPPPPSNNNPTVDCEIERSNVLPGESVGVRATASDPDGDTLSYEWSATAGQIVGTGPAVTFQSTGMTPPASATITVRVSDGRGGSAEDTCPVNMGAEARAEAITCVAGGFSRNSARLNNVDKACLDDVASRMRQDPRSRVVIVGHADSSERLPEVIARQRAEAAKNYLVRDRGIEEARITVRSAAATKPLDTGTDAAARARNRRVELIFVPEGATVPEDED